MGSLLSVQAWHTLLIWLWVGGACGLCAGLDVVRHYQRFLLERKARREVDSLLFRLQLKDLCLHAAKNAARYAREQVHEETPWTQEQMNEVAKGLAKDHVCSYGYTHLSPDLAQQWYISTFLAVYGMDKQKVAVLLLPLKKGKRHGSLATHPTRRAQI